jgi:DNA-binding NtrC family response regulator
VGSNREIDSNVRVIAATNRPLEQMISEGKFREDLFYRLNVVPIFLPALAERKNDIDTLISSFIKKFNKQHTKRIIAMAPDALTVMKKYAWPGNIRELENVIEHAFILVNSNTLTLNSLPESLLTSTGTHASASTASSLIVSQTPGPLPANAPLSDDLLVETVEDHLGDSTMDSTSEANELMVSINGDTLDFNKHKEAFEREFIVKALKMFKGRINQTALHANIPKKTLLRKIEKYGIIARDYADK